jgi:ATP-dependent RNA helicase HelY
VLLQRFTPFDTITRLASTRTYPLQSSFQPSYNMAVNLVRSYDRAEAEHLVNSSFAQYQADRDVVQLEQTKERLEAYHASYVEKMRCHLGNFREYAQMTQRLHDLEDHLQDGTRRVSLDALRSLNPGDVIEITAGKRRGRYAVLEISQRRPDRRPRVLALSKERSMVRFTATELRQPVAPVGHLRLPPDFDHRDARARRRLARRLAALPSPPSEASVEKSEPQESEGLRRLIEGHPCHGCPERRRHLHFATRAARLSKEIAALERRMKRRTGTLARRFELVLEVLEDRGYVTGWDLTDKGEALRRVYNEADLLMVEALERRLLSSLTAADLAAVVSTLVYEPRGAEMEVAGRMPSAASARAWERLMRLWGTLRRLEEARGLELTREPDPGFAERAHAWAGGAALDEVLGEDDAPGDFVRATKQLVDLLRQLELIVDEANLRARLGEAVAGLQRGVVALSSWTV